MQESHKVYKPSQPIQPQFAGGGLAPPKFMPNYYDFLLKDSLQIIKSDVQGGAVGSKTLYVVPTQHTLFITNMWISGECGGGGLGASAYAYLYLDKALQDFLLLSFWDDATNSATNSANYLTPLKLQAGSKILLEIDYNGLLVGGGFSGFLVNNRNFPSF